MRGPRRPSGDPQAIPPPPKRARAVPSISAKPQQAYLNEKTAPGGRPRPAATKRGKTGAGRPACGPVKLRNKWEQMRMLGMAAAKRTPNDQRSDAFNPNSAEHKAMLDNRSVQKNTKR